MNMRTTYDEIEELAEMSSKCAKLKLAIDECAEAVLAIFKRHGLKASGTDPIERVVEALAKFAVESGNKLV